MSHSNDILKISKPSKNDKICIKIVNYFLQNFALVMASILYAVFGALIFEMIEHQQEIKNCLDVEGEERKSIYELKYKIIYYITKDVTTHPKDTWKDNLTTANNKIESWLFEFATKKIIYNTNHYTGQDCQSQGMWFLTNSFLFAVSIITTIGINNK